MSVRSSADDCATRYATRKAVAPLTESQRGAPDQSAGIFQSTLLE